MPYTFSSWTGDKTGTTNPATVAMSADRNVTAIFTDRFELVPVK